jgi:hypothetical protein
MRNALHTWAVLLLMTAGPAHAHFPSGYDLRAIHFERALDGLHAYFRLTLPLVVANDMGPRDATGFAAPAPFTIRRIESAHAFYYPDAARIRREPLALGRLLADGHQLDVDGTPVEPRVVSLRIYPKGLVPPFNTLEQAKASTAPGEPFPVDAPEEVDAAYVAVDAHLLYPHPGGIATFRLRSTLGNQVIGQPDVQNLLVDHAGGRSVVYKRTGYLYEPIEINPSALKAAASFLTHGFEHVTQGLDHLLLVICLALGAVGLGGLIWRVTAFTVGHAVSLALGFFGYVPRAAWFVPAVETAIAASILLAAASVLLRSAPQRTLTVLAICVGLIHGLGFSFALRELLDAEGPHLLASFAAFNLGVEAGQAGFAALVFGGTLLAARWSAQAHSKGRMAAALCCAAVALFWTLERGRLLLA